MNRQGFTLIEVLISVMIIAFMAGSLYATFAAGLKLERRARQSFQDIGETRLIIEQLTRDFGRVVYYDFTGSFADKKSFAVDETHLTFVIDDAGQLRWIRYSLVREDFGKVKTTQLGITSSRNVAVSTVSSTEDHLLTLVREENDFSPALSLTDDFQEREVLTKRVVDKGWNLSFASTLESQPKMEWQTDWANDYMPAAVRMSLSIQSASGEIKKIVRDFILPAGGRRES
ncbi:MAG: prepilin-type N-terminal cleavage/methylation domain-containing protein [Candidatus Omnitrophica bacterium]|nr:prepilin-type N-terminal cleavage/methylation domain-containing protein [Candidatus Omnitrophota bacterium]